MFLSGRGLGQGIISNSQQQAVGQSQHAEVNIMVSQLKENTKLTWMLRVALTNWGKTDFSGSLLLLLHSS